VGLVIAGDARWSSARIVLQSQMIGLTLILLGVGRAWNDFDPAKLSTWLFVLGMGGLLAGLVVLYNAMERRRNAGQRIPPTLAAAGPES
jgi:hypothetical protein